MLTGILTIKPHLFYILFVILGLYMLRSRKWNFFAGLSLSTFSMIAGICVIHPASILNWFSFLSSKAPMDWVGSTFTAWFRLVFHAVTGTLPSWPNIWIPGIALVISVIALWKNMHQIQWIFMAPLLAGLSLFFSPYGHPYDQVILLPIQTYLILYCFQHLQLSHSKYILGTIVLSQLFWFLQIGWISKELHLLAWLTPLLLSLWVLLCRLDSMRKFYSLETGNKT